MGRFLPFLIVFGGIIATLGFAPVLAGQDVDNAGKICDVQTAQQERRAGIPKDLLKAISLAETGRWDSAEQASFAWPWTVMARGRGRFFPTRREALDYIYALRDQGVTNIDVGCMQINLFYHGAAFASIEQALDPQANTAYAARHLKKLYNLTRSWTQAAALYHSSKPAKAKAYKMKVLKNWNTVRQARAAAGTRSGITVASTRIDHVRMAQLNKRRKQILKSSTPADPKQFRREQMAAWKKGGADRPDMGQLAAMRRADLARQRKMQFQGTEQDITGDKFKTRRQQQLDKWRLTGLLAGAG